ncbi:MAG: sigma-70 family RNA polymerase sigma factor [Nitrospirota bacterium]|nr:sigma-70 family RNA polymerase sigma factor [Nitrospirota bacterium]
MSDTNDIRSREQHLAQAAAQGDPVAFEELLSPYMKRAYAYAMRHTGDPTVAEDVCQEAFIKAYRAIGSFAGKSAFSTWLFRIIYTTFLDHVKKPSMPQLEMPEDGSEPPAAAAEAMERFFNDLRSQEREEWLLAGIFKLPPDLRDLVVLRDLQGFSYREIAAITGEVEGTIKSRLSRARERLRALLTADEHSPVT